MYTRLSGGKNITEYPRPSHSKTGLPSLSGLRGSACVFCDKESRDSGKIVCQCQVHTMKGVLVLWHRARRNILKGDPMASFVAGYLRIQPLPLQFQHLDLVGSSLSLPKYLDTADLSIYPSSSQPSRQQQPFEPGSRLLHYQHPHHHPHPPDHPSTTPSLTHPRKTQQWSALTSHNPNQNPPPQPRTPSSP